MTSGNFDLLVLGASGGPLEGHTSSFLLKPSSVSFREIIQNKLDQYLIAIDAGAGLGKLAELISDEKQNYENRIANVSLGLYRESISLQTANQHNIPSTSFLGLSSLSDVSAIELAYSLFDLVKTQLISHPHLDHISGLSINSPAFGFESGKVVYGLSETIQSLSKNIFNDSIWPDLTSSINGRFLTLKELVNGEESAITDIYKVTPFELNHGCIAKTQHGYHSTAHLIHYNSRQIVVFGDVEADADSSSHVALNKIAWEHISQFIVAKTLNTIILECSTPNQPPNMPLYGHLNPDALVKELIVLSGAIKEKLSENDDRFHQPLKGLDILITHVKDRRNPVDPRKVILEELNQLNVTFNLGCRFTILLAGQVYTVN